jgi:hypothetical protein
MQFTRLKEKIEKNYFSSHKLPKQQLTSFWSQGILGVKKRSLLTGPFNPLPVPLNGSIGIALTVVRRRTNIGLL